MVFVEDPTLFPRINSVYYPLFTTNQHNKNLDYYIFEYEILLDKLRSYNLKYHALFTVARETLVFEKIIKLCIDKLHSKFKMSHLIIYLTLTSDSLEGLEGELFEEKCCLFSIISSCALIYGLQYFWKNGQKRNTSNFILEQWKNSNNFTQIQIKDKIQEVKSIITKKVLALECMYRTGFFYIQSTMNDSNIAVVYCKIPPYIKGLILSENTRYTQLNCVYISESFYNLDYKCKREYLEAFLKQI